MGAAMGLLLLLSTLVPSIYLVSGAGFHLVPLTCHDLTKLAIARSIDRLTYNVSPPSPKMQSMSGKTSSHWG